MARVGMGALIGLLRAAANAGTADYVVAGTVAYWTDDQLQSELDRTQVLTQYLRLEPAPTYINGQWQWLNYQIPPTVGIWIERAAADSNFAVKDTFGGTVTDYSIDYDSGLITFDNSKPRTGGSVYFLDCRSYNVNRAAAYVWRRKAVMVANRVDWSSDNHRVSASQQRQAALDMARFYGSLAGPVTSAFYRTDET